MSAASDRRVDRSGVRHYLENVEVTIANGRFKRVMAGTADVVREKEGGETHTVNLRGKLICPGLIDGHVHVTATPGKPDLKNTYKNTLASMNNFRMTFLVKEMLREGFTTARDCGGADSSLKEAIAEWLIPGPRVLIAGHALSQTGGHGDQRSFFNDEDPTLKCCAGHRSGIGRICDGATECSIAVRDAIRKGADSIKIMGGGGVASRLNNLGHPQFLPEEIRLCPGRRLLSIHNGVVGIEHGNFIDRELALEMAEKGTFLTPHTGDI
ncbi:hypothetical protein SUNI508_11707 [Seiridium unicorne]|uniref:Amidohydrolase-related domain-containing protein n=1 Tax=Seiridium unicorne TaxID=138068 RepID=A0ABR2UGP2_9PEZI